jgi:hypothetical protein
MSPLVCQPAAGLETKFLCLQPACLCVCAGLPLTCCAQFLNIKLLNVTVLNQEKYPHLVRLPGSCSKSIVCQLPSVVATYKLRS